jgi:hypothetical protein
MNSRFCILLVVTGLTLASTINAAPADSELKIASCKEQSKLARLYVKYRLAGESKESQLETNRKIAKDQAVAKVYASLINLVYAAKSDELDLVPGLVFSTCMNGPQLSVFEK